jgi:2-polyprenyl-3-methyl-5-hydroxy-6-metoxy-1,4-benzoquinol methylase
MSYIKPEYLAANRATWNALTELHKESNFYNIEQFKKKRNSLNSIELDEIGGLVEGKKLLHLQCHFGMDTLSFAHLGAKVTGVDIADASIELACQLRDDLGLNAHFLASDVYGLSQNLQDSFDIVYTSYGAIGWLPDMSKWAEQIAHFLKEGGFFYMAEFHPAIYMYEWANNFALKYSYFNEKPLIETITESYTNQKIQPQVSYTWNHSISEIVNSLLNVGLELEFINEFPYSVYNCFPNLKEIEKGKYRFKEPYHHLPHTFSLKARKKISHKPAQGGRIEWDEE